MSSPVSEAAVPPSTPVPRHAWSLVASRGVSTLGATLTSFGLNVWVYREAGSYQVFAMLAVLTTLPSLLFAPFAGYLSDRLDKRLVLLGCDLISMFAVMLALAAYLAGHLVVPIVAVVVLALALRDGDALVLFGTAGFNGRISRAPGQDERYAASVPWCHGDAWAGAGSNRPGHPGPAAAAGAEPARVCQRGRGNRWHIHAIARKVRFGVRLQKFLGRADLWLPVGLLPPTIANPAAVLHGGEYRRLDLHHNLCALCAVTYVGLATRSRTRLPRRRYVLHQFAACQSPPQGRRGESRASRGALLPNLWCLHGCLGRKPAWRRALRRCPFSWVP